MTSRETNQASAQLRTVGPTRLQALFGLLLLIVTVLAYLPSLSGELLWDDDGHVTKPELRSFSGLLRIWSEPRATQQYYPLLHSAFWLEHRLWGESPLGYRLLNVLFHATSAFLFASLLRRLAVRGAWLAAFIFALHPVCVESVAWISEQKNTLSLVFYLGAALAYLSFHITRRPSRYALATVLFVAALLCKTVTATLPAALLVVIWWQQGRLRAKRDFLPLAPWLTLGVGAGLVTGWVEHHLIGAQGTDFSFSILARVLLAGRITWFYLGKLLWPTELIFVYPRWTIDPSIGWQYLFPLGVLALAVVFISLRGRSRGPLTCLLLFVGTLVPALGFINVYPFIFSFVADHFQYHACLSIIAALSAGLTMAFARLPRWVALAFSAALVASLGVLTARQSADYRSVFTLFEKTLKKNPAAWMAHSNLALVLTEKGRPKEAVPHLEKALELRPNFPEAENNLGRSLTALGRAPESIQHFERALALQPVFPQARGNLGIALMALGRTTDALASFAEAVREDPESSLAYFNLGIGLAQSGHPDEAIANFQHALLLKPDYAEAELHWAINLTLREKFSASIEHFERACALDPRSGEARRIYGRTLEHLGRIQEAIRCYRRAIEIKPDYGDAHFDLAVVLRQSGQIEEAKVHYDEAVRLNSQK